MAYPFHLETNATDMEKILAHFGSWKEGCDDCDVFMENPLQFAEDGRRQKRDSLTVLPGWNFVHATHVVVVKLLTATEFHGCKIVVG